MEITIMIPESIKTLISLKDFSRKSIMITKPNNPTNNTIVKAETAYLLFFLFAFVS